MCLSVPVPCRDFWRAGRRPIPACPNSKRCCRPPPRITAFFLETCLDQVNSMAEVMQPAELYRRIIDKAKEEERIGGLMPNSTHVCSSTYWRTGNSSARMWRRLSA